MEFQPRAVSRGNRRTLGLSPQRLASRRFLTSLRTVILNIATLIQDTIHRIADLIVKEYVHHLANAEPSVFSILTPRQPEVLQLLSEGKTTKEIAFFCRSV